MDTFDRSLVKYEKLICSGSEIEFVETIMAERRGRLSEPEETKEEKRNRRREEKALINAGLEEADPDRTAPSVYRTRTEIRRIIVTNAWQYLDRNGNPIVPKFLTLTFAENIKDLKTAHAELKKFVRRFNNAFKDILLEPLRYLCVVEFQERGAVHYHMVLFNVSYLDKENFLRIKELWADRFTLQGIAKTNDVNTIIGYVSKYIGKQTADGRFFGQKRYFCSHPLKKPIVVRNPNTIAMLRIHLEPYRKTAETFYPDYMESLYYERYYLGDGKTVFSLPLAPYTRHALELAAQGKEEPPEAFPLPDAEVIMLPLPAPPEKSQRRKTPMLFPPKPWDF